MTKMKEIGRLLCGECDPSHRKIMGRLFDGPRGAELHARSIRPAQPPQAVRAPAKVVDEYDGLALVDMLPLKEGASGTWWMGGQDAVATLSCKTHSWVAVTGDYLRGMEAEYRRTGRRVVRILDHPPADTSGI